MDDGSRKSDGNLPEDELLAGLAASAADPARADWPEVAATACPGADPAAVAERLNRYRAAWSVAFASVPAPPERLDALRAELVSRGLDGFLVPLSDEHQGEFIPARARRLAWLTGFGGSAGLAVVLADRAAIFVDGRYTLQVRAQVDTARFEPVAVAETTPDAWVAEHLTARQKLGFDPWLHTADGVERLRNACDRAGAALVAVDGNPLDAVWADQPPPPLGPVAVHPLEVAGRDSADKRGEIAGLLAKESCAAAVLTAPESIAWLLNVRGCDVPNTPLPLGFAILHEAGGVEWFVDGRKIGAAVREHLGADVAISAPAAFDAALARLGAKAARVRLDRASAAEGIRARLADAGAEVVAGVDPCLRPKARKNDVELLGTRNAHVRDGAALTAFLAWLDGAAPAGGLTELGAVDALYRFRASGARFRGLSFDTISGAGPNGAIVHYRVTEATDRELQTGDVYLVDSGAQYLDGTTDVTRTVFIAGPGGERPGDEVRDRFTRVLRGHIAIATARFPVGTSGVQLDALARLALWQAGLDYEHGTGHGVGSYLGVHEGPQRIAKQGSAVALEPGMIVSNEPGYYKEGGYGIRIENLVAVCAAEKTTGAERDVLCFETLTLAPIDRRLVEPGLLSGDERAWLDAYHARVRKTLMPLVDPATRRWLDQATQPV